MNPKPLAVVCNHLDSEFAGLFQLPVAGAFTCVVTAAMHSLLWRYMIMSGRAKNQSCGIPLLMAVPVHWQLPLTNATHNFRLPAAADRGPSSTIKWLPTEISGMTTAVNCLPRRSSTGEKWGER